MKPTFKPGKNIAKKVPVHEYEDTVSFYRDVLGFQKIPLKEPSSSDTIRFLFGDKVLWIDRAPSLSQAEIWLEIVTDDVTGATDYLERNGCRLRDEIEPLPKNFKGFWISNPANIIHMVKSTDIE